MTNRSHHSRRGFSVNRIIKAMIIRPRHLTKKSQRTTCLTLRTRYLATTRCESQTGMIYQLLLKKQTMNHRKPTKATAVQRSLTAALTTMINMGRLALQRLIRNTMVEILQIKIKWRSINWQLTTTTTRGNQAQQQRQLCWRLTMASSWHHKSWRQRRRKLENMNKSNYWRWCSTRHPKRETCNQIWRQQRRLCFHKHWKLKRRPWSRKDNYTQVKQTALCLATSLTTALETRLTKVQ